MLYLFRRIAGPQLIPAKLIQWGDILRSNIASFLQKPEKGSYTSSIHYSVRLSLLAGVFKLSGFLFLIRYLLDESFICGGYYSLFDKDNTTRKFFLFC